MCQTRHTDARATIECNKTHVSTASLFLSPVLSSVRSTKTRIRRSILDPFVRMRSNRSSTNPHLHNTPPPPTPHHHRPIAHMSKSMYEIETHIKHHPLSHAYLTEGHHCSTPFIHPTHDRDFKISFPTQDRGHAHVGVWCVRNTMVKYRYMFLSILHGLL